MENDCFSFWRSCFCKRKWALFGILCFTIYHAAVLSADVTAYFGFLFTSGKDGGIGLWLCFLLYRGGMLFFLIDLIRGESSTVSPWDKVLDVVLVFWVVLGFCILPFSIYFWEVVENCYFIFQHLYHGILLALEVVTVIRSAKAERQPEV